MKNTSTIKWTLLSLCLLWTLTGQAQNKTMLVTDFYYGNIYGYEGQVINSKIFKSNPEKTEVLKATLDSVANALYGAKISYYKPSPIYVNWNVDNGKIPYTERQKDVTKEVSADYYLRIKSFIRPSMEISKDEEFLLILNIKLLDSKGKKVLNNKVALPFQSIRLDEGFQVEDLVQRDEFFELYNKALKYLLKDEKLDLPTSIYKRLPEPKFDEFVSNAKAYVLAQNGMGGKYFLVDGEGIKEFKANMKPIKEGSPTEMTVKSPFFIDDWNFSFSTGSKALAVGSFDFSMSEPIKCTAMSGRLKSDFVYSPANWTFNIGTTVYQVTSKDEMRDFGVNGNIVIKIQRRERYPIDGKPQSAYKVYCKKGFEEHIPMVLNLLILEDKIIAQTAKQDSGMD